MEVVGDCEGCGNNYNPVRHTAINGRVQLRICERCILEFSRFGGWRFIPDRVDPNPTPKPSPEGV